MCRLLLAIVLALPTVTAVAQTGHKRPVTHPTSCQPHDNVGFGTTPDVLAELTQVYANCYLHPACLFAANPQTVSIDGYQQFANWPWSGPSTHTFSLTEQNAIIDKTINLAGAITPPGKAIVGITFFRDIIVSDPVEYVIGANVTLASCAQPVVPKGLTWIHTASNPVTGTVTVGCNGCDAYSGDTPCAQQLPLLCIYKPTPALPLPVGVSNADLYYQWSGGVIATTSPVTGSSFATSAAATAYCQTQFGTAWRMAEFHDGWGWNFQAYGGTVSAPTVPSGRFWVHINDQPSANCWSP